MREFRNGCLKSLEQLRRLGVRIRAFVRYSCCGCAFSPEAKTQGCCCLRLPQSSHKTITATTDAAAERDAAQSAGLQADRVLVTII